MRQPCIILVALLTVGMDAAAQVSVRSSADVDPAAARTASPLLERLDRASTAGDGARFAAEFSADADVINVSGDHFRSRSDIAKQMQSQPSSCSPRIRTFVIVKRASRWLIMQDQNTVRGTI